MYGIYRIWKVSICFITQNKVTQLDRINAVSGVVEYIPLKSPVVNVRWIRIIPFGHTITASFKFDIVTCENAEGTPLLIFH